MKRKKLRVFAAVFTGNMVFFFLYAGIAWLLTYLKITPYGRFVSTFFKGRTKEEAKAFMEANHELFISMLAEASRFSNLCINPVVGFVTGFVVGMIIASKKTVGLIWALIAIAPVSVLFLVKSSGEPLRFAYLLVLLAAAAAGGAVGSIIADKLIPKDKEGLDVH